MSRGQARFRSSRAAAVSRNSKQQRARNTSALPRGVSAALSSSSPLKISFAASNAAAVLPRCSQQRAWFSSAIVSNPNGDLQMPGSRTASSPDIRWYFANNPSPAVPNGFADEDAIRAVWAADAAKPSLNR